MSNIPLENKELKDRLRKNRNNNQHPDFIYTGSTTNPVRNTAPVIVTTQNTDPTYNLGAAGGINNTIRQNATNINDIMYNPLETRKEFNNSLQTSSNSGMMLELSGYTPRHSLDKSNQEARNVLEQARRMRTSTTTGTKPKQSNIHTTDKQNNFEEIIMELYDYIDKQHESYRKALKTYRQEIDMLKDELRTQYEMNNQTFAMMQTQLNAAHVGHLQTNLRMKVLDNQTNNRHKREEQRSAIPNTINYGTEANGQHSENIFDDNNQYYCEPQSNNYPYHRQRSYRHHNDNGESLNRQPVRNWKISYDGNKDNPINEFINKVENIADGMGIHMDEVSHNLHYLLIGVAQDWFFRFKDNCKKRQICFDWAVLKDGLKRRFQGHRTQGEIIKAIVERKHLENETFDEFYNDIIKLSSQAETPIPEVNLVDMIKLNIRGKILYLMKINEIRTLDELYQEARKAENCVLSRQPSKPFRYINELDYSDTEDSIDTMPEVHEINNTRRKEYKCWNCDSTEHMHHFCTIFPRNKYCFMCGYKDVFTTDCPNRENHPKNFKRVVGRNGLPRHRN